MDGVKIRSLAVLTQTPGPRSTEGGRQKRLRPRQSEHPVAGAPWCIGPLRPCYGNPGGADATADAVRGIGGDREHRA
jgi:hypothetical protein